MAASLTAMLERASYGSSSALDDSEDGGGHLLGGGGGGGAGGPHSLRLGAARTPLDGDASSYEPMKTPLPSTSWRDGTSTAEEELSRRLRCSDPVGLRRRRQPSSEPQRTASSDSDSDSDEGGSSSRSLRRRVSRIFLQRFLKPPEAASEADFCLFFELHAASSDSGGDGDSDGDASLTGGNVTALKDWVRRRTDSSVLISEEHGAEDDSSSSSRSAAGRQRVPSTDEAHTVVEITAMLLRDAGCHVTLYPLQHADAELLAERKREARAYVMTIGFADDAHPTAADARPTLADAKALPAHHRRLPPWVTLHPAYAQHVLPLAGPAQTQQLTKLILTECRADHNLHLASGTLVFAAHRKVLAQLARRADLSVQLYPLHRDDFRARMIRKWARDATYAPPLADIYAYYGPKIAMYFAWLAFYTRMLVVPSACGLGLYVAAGRFNAQSYCVLSFLLAIGTSVFVDLWRRQQRAVEFAWQYNQEAAGRVGVAPVETRAAFRGEWMRDPVPPHARVYDFPRHKRLFRQLLALPLLLSMCCAVGAYVVGLNMLSEHLRALYRPCFHPHHEHSSSNTSSRSSPSPALCALVVHGPGVLNALIIYVMDAAYQQLAWRLNEFENYRTAREFEDNLVLKRMPFHFVNSNASLWFLAFYVQNLERVRERLWILMVGMQLLDNFKEVGLPFVVSLTGEFLTADGRRRRRRSDSSVSGADAAATAAVATGPSGILGALPELQRQHASLASAQDRVARVLLQKRQAQYTDTFADYKEMMIQYGYVALYSPIFPLAPVFAWVNNVIESRSDFLKLVNTHSYQRPAAEHARGIGVWEHVLVAFSVLAVIINFALVWTYELDDLLPSWSELHRFMFIVVCEHLVFLAKVLLNWAAPDAPTWLQNEKRIAALHRTHEAACAERSLLSDESDSEGGSSDSDSDTNSDGDGAGGSDALQSAVDDAEKRCHAGADPLRPFAPAS
ncbi:hypothetical protein PybrP1_002522 [[Pythium] brassicae (nom. inval.)]|nr:hypothetical protein PybrP1_002522 [[Pythium] brassicae (nom. inval.)]